MGKYLEYMEGLSLPRRKELYQSGRAETADRRGMRAHGSFSGGGARGSAVQPAAAGPQARCELRPPPSNTGVPSAQHPHLQSPPPPRKPRRARAGAPGHGGRTETISACEAPGCARERSPAGTYTDRQLHVSIVNEPK